METDSTDFDEARKLAADFLDLAEQTSEEGTLRRGEDYEMDEFRFIGDSTAWVPVGMSNEWSQDGDRAEGRFCTATVVNRKGVLSHSVHTVVDLIVRQATGGDLQLFAGVRQDGELNSFDLDVYKPEVQSVIPFVSEALSLQIEMISRLRGQSNLRRKVDSCLANLRDVLQRLLAGELFSG